MNKTFSFDSFGEMGEFVDFCQENNVRVEFQPQIKRVTVIHETELIGQFTDYRSAQMMQDAMEGGLCIA